MNANEVVVHVVQGHRMRVVLDLLREGIREPGKASDAHPHR